MSPAPPSVHLVGSTTLSPAYVGGNYLRRKWVSVVPKQSWYRRVTVHDESLCAYDLEDDVLDAHKDLFVIHGALCLCCRQSGCTTEPALPPPVPRRLHANGCHVSCCGGAL